MSIENIPNQPEDFDKEVEDDSPEWVLDDTPDIAYMSAMCDALNSIEGMNTMTQKEEKIKKRIKRKALAVILHVVDTVYNEFFDKEPEED